MANDCGGTTGMCSQTPPTPSGMCCDHCQNCNSCNNPSTITAYLCNKEQSYCGPQPETAVGNLFPSANAPTMSRDDIIIKKVPQAELNRWIKWVNDASKYYGGTSGPDDEHKSSPQQNVGAEGRDFVYADKVNELIQAMINVSSKNDPGVKFERDDIIYAEDFNKITKKLNEFYLAATGCPACVSGCNVNCTTCNSCINCTTCTTCCQS